MTSKSLAELAAEDPKLDGALLSKENTLYLPLLGPNNPSLSSPKFGSCLKGVSVCHYIIKPNFGSSAANSASARLLDIKTEVRA